MPSDLFVVDTCLQSQEGTTQGDSIPKAMYDAAVIPLVELMRKFYVTQNVTLKMAVW